jgi:amino acid transporter
MSVRRRSSAYGRSRRITLIGALCYAELGSAHPNAGGEYHYLSRAYGQPVGVLFAWARGTVIQTGAIAAVGFVYGDYASNLIPLGPFGSSIHAGIAVLALTAINLVGTPQSKLTQVLLTALTVTAVLVVIVGGFSARAPVAAVAAASTPSLGAAGLGMVFVLLTYGGGTRRLLTGELDVAQYGQDPPDRHRIGVGDLSSDESRLSQRVRARRPAAKQRGRSGSDAFGGG